MKIVIVGGFGYKDIGDEAILKAMLLRLKSEIPGVNITVLSIDPADTASRHNVKSLNSYAKYCKGKRGILRAIIHFILTFFPRTAITWLLIEPPIREILQEIDSARLVISSGGGFLNEVYRSDLLSRLLEIVIVKIMKKKVMIYGQTLGPFYSRLVKLLVRLVLNHVDLISIRDESSGNVLAELGVTKPLIYLTADEAILLPTADTGRIKQILRNEGIAVGSSPIIGFSVRTWFHLTSYKDQKIASEKFENYKKAIALSADFLAETLSADILFIPMQTGKYPYDDDRNIAIEIKSRMKQKHKAYILTKQYTPEEIKGIIQNINLLVGTRFHSLIFAAATCVPMVAISYWFKIDDFMRAIGLENYSCNINSIEANDLIKKCMLAWSNSAQIKRFLLMKSEELKQKALLNAKLAKYLLYSTNPSILKYERSNIMR